MTPRMRRLWLFIFVICCSLFRAATVQAQGLGAPLNDGAVAEQIPLHEDPQAQEPAGASQVHEAHSILDSLRTPRRTPRLSKPVGFLGSTIYYGTEILKYLFLNAPTPSDGSSSSPSNKHRKVSGPLSEAVNLLEDAAKVGNLDAMFTLAEINFFGNFSHPRNMTRSFELYSDVADATGNRTAQHMMGFMYATGIGEVVEKDQAKALLYHTFAAEQGDARSQMTVAFRHHAGISVPKDCEVALKYYKLAADRAIEYVRSGPPGGRAMLKESYRLADEAGGVYGEGASVSSSGANAVKGGPTSDANAAFDDVLEYLDLMSRQGELKATFGLGRLHYEGSRALKQDFRTAKDHFLDVARKYWTKDGKIKPDAEPTVGKLASKAAGYLGRMFLRGEGTPQDFGKAQIWFRRGVQNGDALCQYSLGLMYLYGLGIKENAVKAADYFSAAADQDFTPAQVRFGALLLDQGDVASAVRYFEFAARNGHLEAFYYRAEISAQGIGGQRECTRAMLWYKIVAEKAEPIHAGFGEANDAYEDGDIDTALIHYMMAAEQGYESAQANVAYLLDRPRKSSIVTRFIPSISFRRRLTSLLGDSTLALIYWTRSAKQANIDSTVRMGDYYLNGIGTAVDAEKAAVCYAAASEGLTSAQAMWNLGWMHENGIGLEQDFHLAKRYYDQSLETNTEAYLPVTLALMKLRVRAWWDRISGGAVNQIRDEPPSRPKFSLHEWLAQFLEADLEQYEAALRDEGHGDEWDGDTVDDVYDDLDESLMETLAIVGLAGALAFLVWYRQLRREDNRRNQNNNQQGNGQAQDEQQQQQELDRGGIPGLDNPELNNWAPGGVGH